jgi:hypothetical protein
MNKSDKANKLDEMLIYTLLLGAKVTWKLIGIIVVGPLLYSFTYFLAGSNKGDITIFE